MNYIKKEAKIMAKEQKDPNAEERVSFDKAFIKRATSPKNVPDESDGHLDSLWEKLQTRKQQNGESE